MRRLTQGLTLVELLIAVVMLGVILSVLAAFFASQARTTKTVQARNDVEVRTRTIAEVVLQDLQMAGSRIVVDQSGTQPVATYVDELLAHCSPLKGSTEHCVRFDGTQLTMFYATSLRLTSDPCRRVDYTLAEGGVLLRSDVACASDPDTDNKDLQPFAENVSNFSVVFYCEADGSTQVNPAVCYTAGSFPSQASVTVTGSSENLRENREAVVTLTTGLPNLRPVAISEAPVGG